LTDIQKGYVVIWIRLLEFKTFYN